MVGYCDQSSIFTDAFKFCRYVSKELENCAAIGKVELIVKCDARDIVEVCKVTRFSYSITVKRGCNELGYNKHSVITNEYLGPKSPFST